ncbi:MAG: hypothetical protein J7K85_08780 [Anaerolineaceae bacterium]|nr:hypothetical protein [Anaerolineaceae bacterium]
MTFVIDYKFLAVPRLQVNGWVGQGGRAMLAVRRGFFADMCSPVSGPGRQKLKIIPF